MLRVELSGDDTVAGEGMRFKVGNCETAICAALVQAGHHFDTPIQFWRGQTLCFDTRLYVFGRHAKKVFQPTQKRLGESGTPRGHGRSP